MGLKVRGSMNPTSKPIIKPIIKNAYVFLISFIFYSGWISNSFAEDFKTLENNISNLRSKIKSSPSKNQNDIQKLYKLENELQKKQYLQKNKAR